MSLQASAEKSHKALCTTLNDFGKKVDEANLNLADAEAFKRRITAENAELLKQLQEMQNDANRCNADVTFCLLMPSTSFQPTFSTHQGFLR